MERQQPQDTRQKLHNPPHNKTRRRANFCWSSTTRGRGVLRPLTSSEPQTRSLALLSLHYVVRTGVSEQAGFGVFRVCVCMRSIRHLLHARGAPYLQNGALLCFIKWCFLVKLLCFLFTGLQATPWKHDEEDGDRSNMDDYATLIMASPHSSSWNTRWLNIERGGHETEEKKMRKGGVNMFILFFREERRNRRDSVCSSLFHSSPLFTRCPTPFRGPARQSTLPPLPSSHLTPSQ